MKVLKICAVIIFLFGILNLSIGLLRVKRSEVRKLYNICCILGYIVAGITLLLSFVYNIIYLPKSEIYSNYLTLSVAISAVFLTFQMSAFIQALKSFSKVRVVYVVQSIILFITCEIVCIVSISCF